MATLSVAILGWIGRHFGATIARRNPRLALLPPALMGVVWLGCAAVGLAYEVFGKLTGVDAVYLFLLPSTAILVFLAIDLWHFWRVGLRRADVAVKKGIDYKRALELCGNGLDFLGTGAAKLSAEPGFEKALCACSRGRPIRFLLMRPDHEQLTRAARNASRDRDEYQIIVRRSLAAIASITERRELNVEVRFYDAPQAFRLMFLDRSVCLASYNVYGRGDGSQLPQLVLVAHRNMDSSFYQAFELYFQTAWDNAEPWTISDWLHDA